MKKEQKNSMMATVSFAIMMASLISIIVILTRIPSSLSEKEQLFFTYYLCMSFTFFPIGSVIFLAKIVDVIADEVEKRIKK